MLYRVFGIVTVAFWLTMSGLLIRTELNPADSRLNAVPLSHVIKLFFSHGQPSDLNIFAENLPLGRLRLTPRIDPETQGRSLGVLGNLRLRIGQTPKQRFSWDATVEMTPAMGLERLGGAFTVQEPQFSRVEFRANTQENRAHFSIKDVEGKPMEEQDFSLDAAGLDSVLQQFGIDPATVRHMGSSGAVRPEIHARQSSMRIHGQTVETYKVSVLQGGQTLLEAHMSQIGQILAVKTFFGYTLSPDDVTP